MESSLDMEQAINRYEPIICFLKGESFSYEQKLG
jgi:hypothetical protein